MKFKKLYNKYINLVCKKFYLLSLIYLVLHLICLYSNIHVSHFLFFFRIEKINLIESIFFLIINFICIFLTQFIISKILIKNVFFVLFTLIFTIPLFISFIFMICDVILFTANYIWYTIEIKDITMSYILKYT